MAKKLSQLPRPERFAKIAVFLIVAGLCAIFTSVGVYIYFFHAHRIGETEDWGAFGAFISGAAGTALSAFTLAALAFTLALQADELAEARELATKQSKILEKQAATLYKQAFESTFFQLLQRFSSISSALRPKGLLHAIEEFVTRAWVNTMPMQDILAWLEGQYSLAFAEFEPELGPYYRTLYHVIKFVDDAELTDKEKNIYISMARAQLGADELVALLMNVIVGKGRVKMKSLVVKYGLLKHARDIKFPPYLYTLKDSAIDQDAYRSRAEREVAYL